MHDRVLDIRQIAQYPQVSRVGPTDAVLIQRDLGPGALGGLL